MMMVGDCGSERTSKDDLSGLKSCSLSQEDDQFSGQWRMITHHHNIFYSTSGILGNRAGLMM